MDTSGNPTPEQPAASTEAQAAPTSLHLTDNPGKRINFSMTSEEILSVLAALNMARCTRNHDVAGGVHMFEHYKLFSSQLPKGGIQSLLVMLCGASDELMGIEREMPPFEETEPLSLTDLLKAAGFTVINLGHLNRQETEGKRDDKD